METKKTHIEIEQHVHLVLDNGDGLEEFLSVHGSHYSVRPTEGRRAVKKACNRGDPREYDGHSTLTLKPFQRNVISLR